MLQKERKEQRVGMVKFRSASNVEHVGSALAKIFWREALRHQS